MLMLFLIKTIVLQSISFLFQKKTFFLNSLKKKERERKHPEMIGTCQRCILNWLTINEIKKNVFQYHNLFIKRVNLAVRFSSSSFSRWSTTGQTFGAWISTIYIYRKTTYSRKWIFFYISFETLLLTFY